MNQKLNFQKKKKFKKLKGSPDPSHFIFEIYKYSFQNRSKSDSTLSDIDFKIKCLWSELPLRVELLPKVNDQRDDQSGRFYGRPLPSIMQGRSTNSGQTADAKHFFTFIISIRSHLESMMRRHIAEIFIRLINILLQPGPWITDEIPKNNYRTIPWESLTGEFVGVAGISIG